MKRFLRMAASAAFVLLLSACARHKIIPDDTLAQIFHDAFLTNAYIGSEGVKTDSLPAPPSRARCSPIRSSASGRCATRPV